MSPSKKTIAAAALAGLVLASPPLAFGEFFAGDAPPPVDGPTGDASRAAGRWSEAVRSEVVRMGERDQELRATLMERLREGGAGDPALYRRLVERQEAEDRTHAERLQGIVEAHGWPTTERAGREAASAAFLIAQHATHDPAFQAAYRDFLEREYREGDVPGEAVALLTDRLRRVRGEPQLYGTQATVQGGRLVLDPIEDSAEVDRRRAELGLPPLGAYLRQLREAYGIEDR